MNDLNDLVSREKAIVYACSGLIRRMDDGDFRRVEDIREALKELPAEQPHWIPCSERLPAMDEYVLVTTKYRIKRGEKRIVNVMQLTESIYEDKHWEDLGGMTAIVEIVAWMPLPEPYGGEGNV